MNAFQASSTKGTALGMTAKEAAIAYFEKFPSSRKCDIREGLLEGGFFTLVISRNSTMFKMNDVSKKMIEIL
jgi:hypothetical protein